jgi:hypothetical protein
MDRLEELEASIAWLRQERDRLKNEALGTNDTTDRSEETTTESHQGAEAQAAETAKTTNGSNPDTPDALSLVLLAESSRLPSLPHKDCSHLKNYLPLDPNSVYTKEQMKRALPTTMQVPLKFLLKFLPVNPVETTQSHLLFWAWQQGRQGSFMPSSINHEQN